MGSDDVTAILAAIRADLSDGAAYPHRVMEIHAPRLVAAVEAAMKLAGEFEAEGYRLDAGAYESCGQALREAITTALTGEEAGDGN